jgi:hypothetical protein
VEAVGVREEERDPDGHDQCEGVHEELRTP